MTNQEKSDKVDGIVFLPTDSMDRLNGDMGIEPKIEITDQFLEESQTKGFWLETFDISELGTPYNVMNPFLTVKYIIYSGVGG